MDQLDIRRSTISAILQTSTGRQNDLGEDLDTLHLAGQIVRLTADERRTEELYEIVEDCLHEAEVNTRCTDEIIDALPGEHHDDY